MIHLYFLFSRIGDRKFGVWVWIWVVCVYYVLSFTVDTVGAVIVRVYQKKKRDQARNRSVYGVSSHLISPWSMLLLC
jgi:hypothetical protein